MRGINYPAGLGTVFIFIGIFCLKALFPKEIYRENNERVTTPMKNYQKAMLLLTGVLCIVAGCLLIVKSIKDV